MKKAEQMKEAVDGSMVTVNVSKIPSGNKFTVDEY